MTTKLARKAVFGMLEKLRHGTLELVCPGETHRFGEPTGDLHACPLAAKGLICEDLSRGSQ